MPHPSLTQDTTPPSEALDVGSRLVAAHGALLDAIEDTRVRGCAYFAAPLEDSVELRDGYYDALARQAAAEAAFLEAKMAFGRERLTRG